MTIAEWQDDVHEIEMKKVGEEKAPPPRRRQFSRRVLCGSHPKGPASKDFKRGGKPRRHIGCRKEGYGVPHKGGKGDDNQFMYRSDRRRLHRSPFDTPILLDGCVLLVSVHVARCSPCDDIKLRDMLPGA
jgi:hypothetical protein